MESNSNSSYESEESWSSFSHTSNPERSSPSNTNRQWDAEETYFHRRVYFNGKKNRESNSDDQEKLGRSYVSHKSVPERSPATLTTWDDGGQDHKNGKQFNKSRPYFTKNRRNPRDESNNKERQPQQIRQSLQQKAPQLQPSSQQQNRPAYSEFGFNQADLTRVDRKNRSFPNEAGRQQQQIGHSWQQETFQSQPTSEQKTPINSTHGFNQEDCPVFDAYMQAIPDTTNDTKKPAFSNKYADANNAPLNSEEWQQQQVQKSFLRADLTPPQQTIPVFPAFGLNSANHSFTMRPPLMMPPYNYSPAPWGMNPMNLTFNLAATALPGTSNLPVASSLPTASSVGLGPNVSINMTEQDGAKTYGAFYPKELITLTKGILCPPYPEDKPPTLRPRPPGCKTVFVGGLPEKATEEIIREIFERCGVISIIRMKKNFCFVRFTDERYVDNAIDLSGYKLKIERKDDLPHCKRLRVDFSYSREDEHEYKCRLQKELREAHHKQKMEEDARCKQKIEEEDEANQLQENKKSGQQNLQEELLRSKEECDSLKCQLITAQNELAELRSEMDEKCDRAESQTGALRHALQTLWQENVSLTEKHLKDKENLEELREQKAMLLNERKEDSSFDGNFEQKKIFGFLTSSSVRLITEKEARLIGLISTFLNAYPLGTSIDCICTYLHKIDSTIRSKDVENFMKRFTLAFKEEYINDSLEKKWTFSGLTKEDEKGENN